MEKKDNAGILFLLGLGVLAVLLLSRKDRAIDYNPVFYREIQSGPRVRLLSSPPSRAASPQPPVAAPGRSYNNLEEWTIERNEKGRISKLIIHRDAREA